MQIKTLKQFKGIVSTFDSAHKQAVKLPFWNGACYMATIESYETFAEDFGNSKLHVLKARIRIDLMTQYMCRLLYDVAQGYRNHMEGWHFPFNCGGVYFDSSEFSVLNFVPVAGALSATFDIRLDYFRTVNKRK